MRQRGTAVVLSNGTKPKVLLVRDRGKGRYSLPGGVLKRGEPTISAAARELFEEVGLHSIKATRRRDCDFKGRVSNHRVCLIEAKGKPHLKGHELDKFIWWDMKRPIPIYAHVKHILIKLSLYTNY